MASIQYTNNTNDSVNNSDNQNCVTDYGTEQIHEACTNENIPVPLMPKKLKVVKTSCMFFVYFGMGLWLGIISPTVVDMSELYNCTYEKFIDVAAGRPIGVMAGSLIGGIAADKFRTHADLSIFLFNLFGGVAMLTVPWTPNFILLGFVFFLNGLCNSSITVLCNSLNIAMWGESAPTPIHALQMAMTIGYTIAPTIAIPFLSEGNFSSNVEMGNNTNNLIGGIHRVRIPYGIIGIYSIVISLIFLAFFIKGSGKYESTTIRKRESFKEMIDPGKIAAGKVKYGAYFLFTLFVIFIFINFREKSLSMFLLVIANTERLKMSKSLSALFVTIFNLSMAIGRGLMGILSRCIPIHFLLFMEISLAIIFQILMMFFALDSVALLFMLSCGYGIASAPSLPTIMSWADRYIEVTGMVVAVMTIGLGIGGFGAYWTAGKLDQLYGSTGIFAVGLLGSVAILALVIPLQIVAHFQGDRHKTKSMISQITVQDEDTTGESEADPLLEDVRRKSS